MTNISGDKKAHCVYMSCGNIRKDVRSKASARCWMKVAEIPVATFNEISTQKGLSHRLYHLCMDIVTESLKQCSHAPVRMTDANGDERLVRTILFVHLADLPEQLVISCCHGGASPISYARHNDFGSGEKKPPRTGVGTVLAIRKLRLKVKASNILQYERAAGKIGMIGVVKPFWHDWNFADPSKFLAPDALHQWHKFFGEHIMKWARKLLGDNEINRRYMCLQKHIQHRHFSNGFTSFGQHTCREYRDLEASFIAAIADHPKITPGIMKAFRALLDFIYVAQFESHTTNTIRQLREHLQTFHANKHHLTAGGLRNGPRQKGQFNIPKLELMNHVPDFIEQLGSVLQYTTEHTERCHTTMAKQPYRSTNKKGHQTQICLILDRRDKIDLFATYLTWKGQAIAAPAPTVNFLTPEANDVTDGQLRREKFLPFARAFIPHPPRDAFQDSPHVSPRNNTTAFVLTDRITHGDARINQIARIYHLPKLRDAITDFYEQLAVGVTVHLLDCWDRVRLQLRSSPDCSNVVMPLVPVLASAPTSELPYGLCNFVLVKQIPGLELLYLRGAQPLFYLYVSLIAFFRSSQGTSLLKFALCFSLYSRIECKNPSISHILNRFIPFPFVRRATAQMRHISPIGLLAFTRSGEFSMKMARVGALSSTSLISGVRWTWFPRLGEVVLLLGQLITPLSERRNFMSIPFMIKLCIEIYSSSLISHYTGTGRLQKR